MQSNMKAILTLSLASAIAASNLYVSSYGGNVTSLSLKAKDNSYELSKDGTYPQCGINPSWLEIDNNRGLVYCVNEVWAGGNGSLSSFTINKDGSLNYVANVSIAGAPVAAGFYGSPSGNRGLAVAHYIGNITTYKIDNTGKIDANEAFLLTQGAPGPAPAQTNPRAHHVAVDPTGQYIVVPDLGADLLRVYSWNKDDLKLTEKKPFQVPAGNGPRHAAFYTSHGLSGSHTYLYVVSEISATVTSYCIKYNDNNDGLNFQQRQISSTLGYVKAGAASVPAEILVTPDNRYVLVSNRKTNDTIVPVPLNNASAVTFFPQYTDGGVNGTLMKAPELPQTEVSDSISVFRIDADATLTFQQHAPAGGLIPRSMSISPDGSMLALGLMGSNRVAVYERNINTGLLGPVLASVNMDGPGENMVSSVVWGL
jgi:6-phosphogluconolactonase (cycloisomerase 2 family)